MSASGRARLAVAVEEGGQGGDVVFGQGEGALVFGADCGVEQAAVAQAHLRGDVTEQRHQRLQGYSGVDQCGGVGVAQLMWGDVVEAGSAGGAVEFGADRVLREAVSLPGEQELGRFVGAGCGNGRPCDRIWVIRSINSTVCSSSGIIRSVSSLPSGTFSQVPCPGISCTQSSSRSSNSPIRSPQARCSSSADAASW